MGHRVVKFGVTGSISIEEIVRCIDPELPKLRVLNRMWHNLSDELMRHFEDHITVSNKTDWSVIEYRLDIFAFTRDELEDYVQFRIKEAADGKSKKAS